MLGVGIQKVYSSHVNRVSPALSVFQSPTRAASDYCASGTVPSFPITTPSSFLREACGFLNSAPYYCQQRVLHLHGIFEIIVLFDSSGS